MGEGAVKETILPNFNDSFLPAQNMWIVFFKYCFILIAFYLENCCTWGQCYQRNNLNLSLASYLAILLPLYER